MRWAAPLAAILVLTLVLPALAATPSEPLPAEYQVLLRKSMFARDRGRRERPPATTTTTAAPVARAPALPVLVGIVMEEEGPVALLESPDTGTLTQARIGDELPGTFGGKVQDITLDHMELRADEGAPPRRIAIGQSLQGRAASLPSSSRPAGDAPAASPGTPGIPTTPATPGASGSSGGAAEPSDALERMRRRRQQELGQ